MKPLRVRGEASRRLVGDRLPGRWTQAMRASESLNAVVFDPRDHLPLRIKEFLTAKLELMLAENSMETCYYIGNRELCRKQKWVMLFLPDAFSLVLR